MVGAIIGELPSSIQDGLAGAILNFNQYYITSPESLWATNIIAALLGIAFFASSPRRAAVRPPCAGERRMTEAAAVSVTGLSKRFERGDVLALERIDLDVQPGEFVSLIGPSGCGKSTLLRIIGDLIRPSEGEVLVNGKTAHRARLDRDYGIVFQDAVLYDWRTVAKNIALPLEMAGWDQAPRDPRRRDGRPRRADRLREAPPLAALGRDAAARLDRAGALVLAPAAPDGRALRRPRRDDARADEQRAAADLAGDALDRRLRHPLDRRIRLPLDPRRRHVGAAGPDRGIVQVELPQPRGPETREDPRFAEHITEVRRLLRKGHALDAPEEDETPLYVAEEGL